MANENERNIAGVKVPCIHAGTESVSEDFSSFVYEVGTSPYINIQQLALAVSCNRPVLLQGPVGSGKTSTVEYLAFITGHRQFCHSQDAATTFVKVQLGEQTDSKMLLGGYQSTEIPGRFVWKPGVLTSAVVNGYWILLEDIDSTSSDVLTVVDNLIKNQSLTVPGFGTNIIPHPEFRLFATQRTINNNTAVMYNGLKNWFIIQLKPLSCRELVAIISKRFPSLSCIANKMVSILYLEYPIQSSDRIPSVRDLLKWCNRCSKYFETGKFDVSLRLFQDAVDIFCGYMDKNSSFFSEQIGLQLGIVKNKAIFLNDRYKPLILKTEKSLVAGRSSLDRCHQETVGLYRSRNFVFSLTAPSCRLVEKIACCLENNEPVLLVGETGCGKTTVLQYMARIAGKNIIVINMNQQSDTADLIGGFKPVSFRWIMKPLCDEFEALFRKLYDAEKNRDCLNKFLILFNTQKWDVLLKFISYVQEKAVILIQLKVSKYNKDDLKYSKWITRLAEWEGLGAMVKKYTKQCEVAAKSLVFSYIEGSLVTAVKRGDWVLLDEINLATSETLDCLSGLLEDSRSSLLLLEKGESKPVLRDSGFRLFAAMNPATDVGKKRLPVGLRNRFTEFFVEELTDELDLYSLVETYVMELNYPPERIKKIVNFYLKIRKNSKLKILDGSGKRPHYSLRNLCRALTVASKNLCGNPLRSLYEGLHLSFLTQLDKTSYDLVHGMVVRTVTDIDIKVLLNQPIPRPENNCVEMEGFWIPVGGIPPVVPDNYILTDTVRRHLKDIIRIISLGSGIPILLEGDTSVGKTSLINYLAKCTGNYCARVNNHEHTDIQEYIGTYVADKNGKLIFKEGILCEAMRKGYWLILDELNLAPSEVLEALNRVLDDNRELFIPETQTVIKANPKFMLFATQNPPGLYGGRKELSRAFKNRFIGLQFGQIPADELITILEKRCQMPLTYCKKMVAVMTELQLRRRGSEIFVGKSGFITLRDLFRWGERYQKAIVNEKFYDWEQHLADEGYILLAGRVRLPEECKIIEEVLSKHFKRRTNPNDLFTLHENTSPVSKKLLENILSFAKSKTEFKHIVWTYSMRRLAVLVCKAIEFSEPVLLVGETGCGKTTIVQILALLKGQSLYCVNCHTHSESADFLGGLRPVREESRAKGKLFEWCDGPLVQAMKTGSIFLADEISLADDSVLERLNSLLEPERTILLTEKGGSLMEDDSENHLTVATESFQFVGTMNPGGDFGKKELSPALRNRFTEIWVEVYDNRSSDLKEIINFNLNILDELLRLKISEIMVNFIEWFQRTDFGKRLVISVRDVMTWVKFMNGSDMEWYESCLHGCCLSFLDGLGCGTSLGGNFEVVNQFRLKCLEFLVKNIGVIIPLDSDYLNKFCGKGNFVKTDTTVGIHPFYINRGVCKNEENCFFFNVPTTFSNTLRLLRGLQMNKAILLEGSPGVGKTSLVSALAKVSGHKLTRINLSDQTDISDLFGADLPEEGATAGHFVWRDGPFLTALKNGHWILLDELNLALQSVLEGLNAVLDHRGTAYIPELNKTFHISKKTKLFACQNPLKEGGNRRGLPKSLLNRFTQVFIEPLSEADYGQILKDLFPDVAMLKFGEHFIIDKMVEFNEELCRKIKEGKIGSSGGPWEFNLRDITRWVQGILKVCNNGGAGASECGVVFQSYCQRIKEAVFDYCNLLYFSRFRSKKDVSFAIALFDSVFGYVQSKDSLIRVFVTEKYVKFGDEHLSRNFNYFYGDFNEFEMFVNVENSFGLLDVKECFEISRICKSYRGRNSLENLRLLEKQYPVLRSLCQCIERQWLVILVGDPGTGKTSCVRALAALANKKLRILSCNSAMDTNEILGGFEQTDYNRHLDEIAESAKTIALTAALRWLRRNHSDQTLRLLNKWLPYSQLPVVEASAEGEAICALLRRLDFLDSFLISEMSNFDSDLKAIGEQLCIKLKKLRETVNKDEEVTSGGKFEWVDSVLIKCLVDGSWLLMEDVNLCSSAVLDRLNCLLEPNGCLTVGERGACVDGSLFTISPHPDFRLFFTMNPKNGPISRAMRNRGVEIYLAPDSEIDVPIQDKLIMLNDCGIHEMDMQIALMKFDSAREVPNMTNLVANAFWTAQYLSHGFEKTEAFLKSTQQVYHMSAEDVLQSVNELSLTWSSSRTYSMSFARPPLSNFFIHDVYARLKQSSSLLVFLTEVLKNYKYATNVPLEDLKYFFGSDIDKTFLDISDGMKYSILYTYILACGKSVDLTPMVLRGVLKDLVSGEEYIGLVDTLGKVISEEPIVNELVGVPWDLRWYGLSNATIPIKNKTLILLKFTFLLYCESREISNNLASLKKKEIVTVAEYSKAVREGYLKDLLPDYPVFERYNTILDSFEDFLLSYLKSKEVLIDDESMILILKTFKWRFWLGSMANKTLLSGPKRKVNEETLTQVSLYFMWFYHFFVKHSRMITLSDVSQAIMGKYEKFVENLEGSLRSDVSVELLKISNTFRRSLGHPSPEKYLPEVESYMELRDPNEFRGDPVITRSVLNKFIHYFHTSLLRQTYGIVKEIPAHFWTENDEMMKLKLLFDEYRKYGHQLSSEVMYYSLRALNADYEFYDALDGTEEELYSKQILIFHRPVWACRIINFLFRSTEKWSMINYSQSEKELRDIVATVFPQTCIAPDMDPRANEWMKLSVEMTRTDNSLKECFGVESEALDVKTVLRRKLEDRGVVPSVKILYDKVCSVLNALHSMWTGKELEYYSIGCCWTLVGLLKLIILQGTKVDPIRRKLLKLQCARSEVKQLEPEIQTFELSSRITGTVLNHPYLSILREDLETFRQRMYKYNNLERVKRDPETFKMLALELDSYVDISSEIIKFSEGIITSVFEATSYQRVLKNYWGKARFIRNKTKHLIKNLEKYGINYFGDLSLPVLAGAAQIEHGMNLITSELLRKPFCRDIMAMINDFGMYPIPEDKESLHPFHVLNAIPWCSRTKQVLESDKLILLFMSCRIKCNEWLVFKTEKKYDELISILSIFVEFWKSEEDKRLKKNLEEESLFMKRGTTKCITKTEEEELMEEQLLLFPTYENYFDEKILPEEEKEDKLLDYVSPEQLSQVSKMHMKLVKEGARFNWITENSHKLSEDYFTPLRLRYLLLSHILPQISFALEYKTDSQLLPGLLPLIYAKEYDSISSEVTLLQEDYKIYDFYKDKNISEANKCLEILNDLKGKTLELLEQWSNHPALLQMNVIIERIMSFSIESPLMKFLTGLELLLQSCQNWESVAHSGVSISDNLVRLTNLIIDWRKLELQGWKNCLETARVRMEVVASKWWYHVWSLTEEYLSENAKSTLSDMLKALHSFIENSPIGEFEYRLDVLLSFHCHVTRLYPSVKRDKLAISLWNLYAFYSQYKSEVAKKLIDLSAPVVKKVKDYVNIAKWNDITYWSVKKAIEKSHRSLLKFIKEYEKVLKQPVQLFLIDPKADSVGNNKSSFVMNINKFIKGADSNTELESLSHELGRIIHPYKKFEKAKKFCTDIILTAEYPILINHLEFLSEEICEGMDRFKDLDVDRTLPQEKQKSQAKSIVQQKRRALADLFKTLQLIGLSYRAGITYKDFGILDLCETVPMIITEKSESGSVSGEEYYLKSFSRRLVLENALLVPSKEIGPPVIERLRGFASHIVEINKNQKFSLSKVKVAIVDLRRYEALLTDLTSNTGVVILDQRKFENSIEKFMKSLNQVLYTLEQFALILKSWPTEGEKLKKMNFLGSIAPEIITSSIFEDLYINTKHEFEEIYRRTKNLKKSIENVFLRETTFSIKFSEASFSICKDDFVLYCMKDVEQFNSYVAEFRNIITTINKFSLIFRSERVDNCLAESLIYLGKITCDDFIIDSIEADEKALKKCLINLESDIYILVENILLIIQRLMKKYRNFGDVELEGKEASEEKTKENDYEDGRGLVDNHLSKKLVQSLRSDLEDLNVNHINNLILSILKSLNTLASSQGHLVLEDTTVRILSSSLPFVRQYLVLCSYFEEQQSYSYRTCNKLASILIGTFIQIAQKGFCIPPEYEEEEGEGPGNQGGGGMGLGEGEGKRDVSDKIESEDQLEGAEPEGKEKEKEEDRDCKEEENGIEMSEDFEGKAQDLDKKGDDDETGDEEEEEPDVKEMGETEKDAEKLEEELWSSDDENEEDGKDKEMKEEMGSGKGKQKTEDKYANKETEDTEQHGEDETEEKKEKRKDDIDEINEQEDSGDQIDPYHGNYQPEPEPEPFELPDNLDLDNGDVEDNEEEQGENPFDIDAMKEAQPPNEIEEEKVEKSENKEEEMEQDDQSEDDEIKDEGLERPDSMEIDENGEEKIDDVEKNEKALENEDKEEEEEEAKVQTQDFQPSDDKPTDQPAQPAPDSEKDELASKDQVVGSSKQTEFQTQAQEVTEKSREESKGTGQAEVESMNEGHEVGTSNKDKIQPGQYKNDDKKQKKRPGRSDEDRTLADSDLNIRKKLRTLEKFEGDEETGNDAESMEEDEAELYQHVKENIEKAAEIIDAATKEQAESQAVPNKEEEEAEKLGEDEDVGMDVDNEKDVTEEIEELKPSEGQKMKDSKKRKLDYNGEENMDEEMKNELEGENVATATVERGPDTTYHTNLIHEEEEAPQLEASEVNVLRLQIQEQLNAISLNETPSQENVQAWSLLNSVVEELSRELTEQLRLILEPTKATRLKGDYRTGRRINMRKVISYIASEFRKDSIWLRRTKPWKRDHEIVLAIDDSSSMDLNNSKELAFESLALVSKALGLLEAGQLGVLSFGERTKIVHPLGEPFVDETGARLLKEFTFSQNKTLISEMLDISTSMMTTGRKKGEVSQLLIIISDGRGVFSEGLDKVKLSVRRAIDQGIFLVFVIIDEPKSKDSIMDIRMPQFRDGKFLGIKSYLEEFPFPYYLILRDIAALPRTLGDALRQWFQFVTSSNIY